VRTIEDEDATNNNGVPTDSIRRILIESLEKPCARGIILDHVIVHDEMTIADPKVPFVCRN
jgi:hypothetical protein